MSGAWSIAWRGFWGGAWGYIPEPFTPSKFITRVSEIVTSPAKAGRPDILARIRSEAVTAFIREDEFDVDANATLEPVTAVAELDLSPAIATNTTERQVVPSFSTDASVQPIDNKASAGKAETSAASVEQGNVARIGKVTQTR